MKSVPFCGFVRVLALLTLLLGAGCESEPGCLYTGACANIEGESARSCINFCMPVAPDEALEDGSALCALDPCNEEVLALPGTFACPPNYHCGRPIDASRGRCVEAESVWGEECRAPDRPGDPFIADLCGKGMYCSVLNCARTERVSESLGVDYTHGVCLDAIGEGGACDSNLSEADMLDPNTNRPVGVGCAPCEEGTWCVPNSLQGIDTPGSTCARLCGRAVGDTGLEIAEDGMCPCGNATCETLEDVQSPRTNEKAGPFFCKPCHPSTGQECDPAAGVACCDDEAECQEVDYVGFRRNEDQGFTCCRGENTECEVGSLNQCCLGTRCDEQTSRCEVCARHRGDAATRRCCPGYERVTDQAGNARCEWCGGLPSAGIPVLAGFRCSEERFLSLTSGGRFDAIPIMDTDVPWHQVVGNTGGELIESRRKAERAEYTLTSEHRAYFFGGDLSNGVTAGESFLHMPRSDGTFENHVLPNSSRWEGARVYDSGACSLRIGWTQLANQLVIELSQRVGDIEALSDLGPLTHTGTSLRPILRSEPTYAIMPLGRQDTDDGIHIDVGFNVPEILDCGGPAEISISADLSIETEPAFRENTQTPLSDANAAMVGCTPTGAGYSCIVPDAPDLSAVRTRFIALTHPDQIDYQARRMAWVGCRYIRDQYGCLEPGFGGDGLPIDSVTYARPVDYVPNAKDLVVDLDRLDLSLPDCFWDGFTGPAQRTLVRELTGIDSLSEIIRRLAGEDAISDFGLTAADVPACTTDADCQAMPLFGGERHTCDTAAGICSNIVLEPRRVNIRPDGIEFVLAEDLADPQAALVQANFVRNSVTSTGDPSPLSVFLASCEPDRYSVDPVDGPFESTLRTATADSAFNTVICDDTAMRCRGICPQYGTPCREALRLGAVSVASAPGARWMCDMGVCAP
ncbi:MAG: hypothetical protein AAGF12_22685 [Myxococcota bacterium]